jgi:circadian clock protein KaiC
MENGLESTDYLVPTGVHGFDVLLGGGIPRGSLVLIAGEAGSGKTIFSAQYLYHGALELAEPGIYVSFAESRETFLENMKRLGMDFERLEREDKFKFLDYATITQKAVTETLTNVLSEMDCLKAKRLVIDSFTALAQAFKEPIDARAAIHAILGKMVRQAGCTTLLITEKTSGAKQMGLGMEEFVADGVVLLISSSERGYLERRLQVVKMRGAKTCKQGARYDIREQGITIYQPVNIRPITKTYTGKLSTGIKGLDEIFGGGFPKASVTMVAGGSGTGKTTIGLHFIVEGAVRNERSLFISFEESEAKLVQHGEGLGWDFQRILDKHLIRIEHLVLNPQNIDEQLFHLYDLFQEYRPARVVIDSVVAIERAMVEREYFEHMNMWNCSFSADGVTVLLTAPAETTISLSANGISRLVDNIIFLRDVEVDGALKRSLTVLKGRSTAHDRHVREFEITSKGAVMKGKFAGAVHVQGGSAGSSLADEATISSATRCSGEQ